MTSQGAVHHRSGGGLWPVTNPTLTGEKDPCTSSAILYMVGLTITFNLFLWDNFASVRIFSDSRKPLMTKHFHHMSPFWPLSRFWIERLNIFEGFDCFLFQIYGLMESDFGGYQCKATNAHGEHTQTVELIQTKIPIPEAAYGGSLQHTTCIFTLLACAITFSISFLLL